MAPTEVLWVVETCEGDAFLGRIDLTDGNVVVYSGFVGRPIVIPAQEVDRMVRAEDHPDVELVST